MNKDQLRFLGGFGETQPSDVQRRPKMPHPEKNWEPRDFKDLVKEAFTFKRKGEIHNWLARIEERYGSISSVLCQNYLDKVNTYFREPWPSQVQMSEGRGTGDFKSSLIWPFLIVWRWVNYEKLWEKKGERTNEDKAIEELKFGPDDLSLYRFLIGARKVSSAKQVLDLAEDSKKLVGFFYWRHFFKKTQLMLEKAGFSFQPDLKGVKFPEEFPVPVYRDPLSKG